MPTQRQMLDARIKSVLVGQGVSNAGGVPSQRGLIRSVMVFCQTYRGQHPMILAMQTRMANHPGWRPTYAYARTIKDLIDKIGTFRIPEEVDDDGPTSLD